MRASIAFILLFSTCTAVASDKRCKELKARFHNSMQPQFVVGGGLETTEDKDEDTVQIVVIDGLAPEESKVSASGQIIYISRESLGKGGSSSSVLLGLLGESLVRRIAEKEGVQCPSVAKSG